MLLEVWKQCWHSPSYKWCKELQGLLAVSLDTSTCTPADSTSLCRRTGNRRWLPLQWVLTSINIYTCGASIPRAPSKNAGTQGFHERLKEGKWKNRGRLEVQLAGWPWGSYSASLRLNFFNCKMRIPTASWQDHQEKEKENMWSIWHNLWLTSRFSRNDRYNYNYFSGS